MGIQPLINEDMFIAFNAFENLIKFILSASKKDIAF